MDNNSPVLEHRTANIVSVSVHDPLGRWGLGIDTLVAGALGLGIAPIASAFGACGSVSDAVLMAPDALLGDVNTTLASVPVDAVKLGSLLDPSLVDAVTDGIVEWRGGTKPDPGAAPIVIDPVLFDRVGAEVASKLTAQAYVRRLLPLASVVTANFSEAGALVGFPVGDRSSMKDACKGLFDRGVGFPLVKGHLQRHSIDIAYDGTGFVEFGVDKLPQGALGSGSAHSAAIACLLARGLEPLAAFDRAKTFVTAAIKDAVVRGPDLAVVNPMAELYAAADMRLHAIPVTSEP